MRSDNHLVSLGGKDPLNEYLHKPATGFERLLSGLDGKIMDALTNLPREGGGKPIGLPQLGHGATWTYVINVQPFGDFSERMAKDFVQLVRKSM